MGHFSQNFGDLGSNPAESSAQKIMRHHAKIADILLDALPFIRLFRGKIIVIKYGGAAQIDANLKEQFGRDIALLYMLGIRPVIVHGGGKDIDAALEKFGVAREFVDGHRKTTAAAMKVVDMVLGGSVNKELSQFLNYHGARAVGLSGKDARMLLAKERRAANGESLGYTGDIVAVNTELIFSLLNDGFVPVVAPLASSVGGDLSGGDGVGSGGNFSGGDAVHLGGDATHPGFNINADLAACAIATALKASKIIFLSDIKGVLDKDGALIPSLTPASVRGLVAKGVITGGMIPKLEACVKCVSEGVEKAHIIDGRIEHALLLELFTTFGIGTEVTNG